MANKKISQLTAAAALTGTELLPIVQGGETVQTTAQDIADLGGGGLSYKVYTAKVIMSDGSATVFENTLGVTITWTSTSGQISTGVVAGLIGQNNVYVQVNSSTPSSEPYYIVSGEFTPSPWVVKIKQNDTAGAPNNLQEVYVEIRIYS
jgi:hypothetical protein